MARTHHLPGLEDLEIVRRALPLASIAALPSQDRDDGLQDRGAVMQQRSDAYHLIRYVSILEEDLAEKFVDLSNVDTMAELLIFGKNVPKIESILGRHLNTLFKTKKMLKSSWQTIYHLLLKRC